MPQQPVPQQKQPKQPMPQQPTASETEQSSFSFSVLPVPNSLNEFMPEHYTILNRLNLHVIGEKMSGRYYNFDLYSFEQLCLKMA